jgi:hypothetical protein
MIAPEILAPDRSDINWVERLRRGNYVWLPKERRYASIVFSYEPPDPGGVSGRIALRKVDFSSPPRAGYIEDWFILPDGRGFDNTQIMLPCVGNLDDDPPAQDHTAIRRLMRLITQLQHRMERLETELHEYRGQPYS